MIYDILAYIIIFLAFAYPVYNIYKLFFTKKTYGCACCNSNCALRNVKPNRYSRVLGIENKI